MDGTLTEKNRQRASVKSQPPGRYQILFRLQPQLWISGQEPRVAEFGTNPPTIVELKDVVEEQLFVVTLTDADVKAAIEFIRQ